METSPPAELLLLATEEQVHAFDLTKRQRITLGRHESNEVQLSSRTVSNFHAEIAKEDGGIVLRDLGSTNGTFVGEEPIKIHRLSNGDRIRIGNHTLTMQLKTADESQDGFIRYRRDAPSWGPGARGRVISFRVRSADASKTLQVTEPNDLSLPDLLNRLSRNGSPLCARLEHENEHCALFAVKNRIVHAEYGTSVGEKALYRIFCWQEARYEVEALENTATIPRSMGGLPTETLIMEGMKNVLELGKLIAELPPLEVPLRLKENCPLPLTAHSPAEIEIFQEIIRLETIGAVMERSPLTDVRVLKLIESLLRKGVFEVAREAPSLSETFISPPGEVSPLRRILPDS